MTPIYRATNNSCTQFATLSSADAWLTYSCGRKAVAPQLAPSTVSTEGSVCLQEESCAQYTGQDMLTGAIVSVTARLLEGNACESGFTLLLNLTSYIAAIAVVKRQQFHNIKYGTLWVWKHWLHRNRKQQWQLVCSECHDETQDSEMLMLRLWKTLLSHALSKIVLNSVQQWKRNWYYLGIIGYVRIITYAVHWSLAIQSVFDLQPSGIHSEASWLWAESFRTTSSSSACYTRVLISNSPGYKRT